MPVLEHYFREEAGWGCGQPWIRHSSPSSPVPQDPSTNQLTPNQWKNFPESRLLAGEREHESTHQEEISGLSRRIKPQDCRVIRVGTETRFPLTPVKPKDSSAQGSGGTVGLFSPFPHPQRLPPSWGTEEGAPSPLLPTSGAVQSGVAGKSSCCSVMLKAEKYHVKIFRREGRGLILKECIITQNNWSLHAGNMGVTGSELQSGGMGDDCSHLDADIFC